MEDKELKSKIAEGHIHVRAILEIVGKPAEHVMKALNNHIDNISESKTLEFINKDIEEPKEHEGFFSAFAEVEILVKDAPALMDFCFDYMPSSIEIIEPERFILQSVDFTDFLNDLQQRLHTLNTAVIQLKDNNSFYVKNTAVLLRNFIVVLLRSKAMTLSEIKPFLGVKEEDIQKVINVLMNEGKVVKQGDKYKAK